MCWRSAVAFRLLPFVIFSASAVRAQSFPEPGSVLVTHLSADYAAANDEFVVLYNATSDTAHLDGYELRYYTSSGNPGSAGRAFPSSSVIPPFSHVLIAVRETVLVGSALALRDESMTSGMASAGGQLLLRSTVFTDSIVFAVAWGSVTTLVGGMTDAASWPGDGMLRLTFDNGAYIRSTYAESNGQYQHVPSDAITFIPSMHPLVPLIGSAWRMRFIISQGEWADSSLSAGMVVGATDAFDPGIDAPQPPPLPAGAVSAAFLRPAYGLATGPRLSDDFIGVQSLASSSRSWYLGVVPGVAGVPVSVSIMTDSLPPGTPIVVLDASAGTRQRYTSPQVGFDYVPQSSDERVLRVAVGDSAPPNASFLAPTEGKAFVAGRTEQIRWTISDASGVDSVWVELQSGPGQPFAPRSAMSVADSGASWLVSSADIGDSLRLRLSARDSSFNVASVTSDVFRVVPDTATAYFGAGWHLMGLPLIPFGPLVRDVVPSGGSDSSYLFQYTPSAGYAIAESLKVGSGYFLGLLSGRSLRVAGTAAEETLSIPLWQGFNIVSSQSISTVSRDDLAFEKEGLHYTYAQALSSGLIAAGFTTYDPATGTYIVADSVRPWEGYWLPVMQSGLSLVLSDMPRAPFRRRSDPSRGWRLRLYATVDGVVDSLASLGTDEDATNGFDPRFDAPRPPQPPEAGSVSVFFDHPEWIPMFGSKFVGDIRERSTGHTWRVTVRTPAGVTSLLSWRGEGAARPDVLELADETGGVSVRMDSIGSYQFVSGGERIFSVRSIATHADRPDENAPVRFEVSQNYPNPFNGSTTIPFAVPERSFIRLAIYDVLGRLEGVVVQDWFDPGRYEARWLARAASGVYIAAIEGRGITGASRFHERIRIILVK